MKNIEMVDWLVAVVEDGHLWVNGARIFKPRPETWAAIGTDDILGWLRVKYLPRGKTVKFYTEEEMRNEHTRRLE